MELKLFVTSPGRGKVTSMVSWRDKIIVATEDYIYFIEQNDIDNYPVMKQVAYNTPL